MGNKETTNQETKKVVYDPLVEIIQFYSSRKKSAKESRPRDHLSVEERLKNRIIDGEKKGLDTDLEEAMKTYPPLDIINNILLEGMKVVGDLFGKGEMQLPFVLQSAEVMKAAVAHLEPFMEKTTDSQKGTIVLATVKGDVHDIGKNLVDIILTNNGYRVINLGIKCPIDTMLKAVDENRAHALGMSGLLVKSTLIMKENLEVMMERGIQLPVLLGGAALTKRYVEEDLRSVYSPPLFYCEDAFAGLHAMGAVLSGQGPAASTDPLESPADSVKEIVKRIKIVRHQWNKALEYVSDDDFVRGEQFGKWSLHDLIAHLIGWNLDGADRIERTLAKEAVPSYSSDEVNAMNDAFVAERRLLSREALIEAWSEASEKVIAVLSGLKDKELSLTTPAGTLAELIAELTYAHEYDHLKKIQKWIQNFQTRTISAAASVRSDVRPSPDFPKPPFWGARQVDTVTLEDVYPYINEIALFRGQWQFNRGKRSPQEYETFVEQTVRPIFEAWKKRAADERRLIPKVVYGYYPCQSDGNDLIVYHDDMRTERTRFTFPRQPKAPHYCISDFFADRTSGRIDVLGCMLVTVGTQASDFAAELFASNDYADYLYFHGLSVESAEALAEYWHKTMRRELGLDKDDHADVRKLFQQTYRGSRYSFGYPACPNLEDQVKLFELLEPERIGVSLTEEFHLIPEQSTSAIVVHHPDAKYFNIH